MTLRSQGEGATIDAQGCSRHFDVSYGGELHLERVHLVNGGMQAKGGAVQVQINVNAKAQFRVLAVDSLSTTIPTLPH